MAQGFSKQLKDYFSPGSKWSSTATSALVPFWFFLFSIYLKKKVFQHCRKKISSHIAPPKLPIYTAVHVHWVSAHVKTNWKLMEITFASCSYNGFPPTHVASCSIIKVRLGCIAGETKENCLQLLSLCIHIAVHTIVKCAIFQWWSHDIGFEDQVRICSDPQK